MKTVKICQNCKTKFKIEPEDLSFYEKISVPAPTFCPECRAQRRLASWNERVLYRRKCDLCGEDMVSIYSSDKPFKVYCNKCWWSDKWDAIEYGRDYDFSKPFFEQFYNLQKNVPIINLLNKKSINSDYCHDALEMKNCYLVFLAGFCEDTLYGTHMIEDKDCMDGLMLLSSELCYQCVECASSYKLFFSYNCQDCRDSAFLFNCSNCSDCFSCVNLKHKKYHIFNQPYSKEEYQKKIAEFNLGSYQSVLRIKNELEQFRLKFPRKYAEIYHSINVLGDNIIRAKNCWHCFQVNKGTEDSKYLFLGGWQTKNCYDLYNAGLGITLSYESVCLVDNCYRALFTSGVWTGRDIEYADYCHNSSELFGCVSLRNKKNCILNKQYSKEEFDNLRKKIIQQMSAMPYKSQMGQQYKYGEYFPIELSRFAYNETIAQEYFPLTKEQALEQGYAWYDKPKPEYQATLKAKDIKDNITDTDDSILKEVIACASPDCQGSGVFRLIKPEYDFYQKHQLPIPRLCPDCRHHERIKQRNPMKLYHRQCMNQSCPNEFETTYAPERPEIVYCEKCYQKEVE